MEEKTFKNDTDVSMVLNLQEESLSHEKAEKDVTSKAIIKYKDLKPPVPFRQLEEETNLNSLPESWLEANLSGRFSDAIKTRKPIDLSSFSMASRYLDHVGHVDVISDAENIKRLLKTPYSDTGLSMAVHRIRNTLLINEFDIPKIISTASQNPELGKRLDWLKQLYCEVVGSSQENDFRNRKGSIDEDVGKQILSKFLHYSIASSPDVEELSTDKPNNITIEQNKATNVDTIGPVIEKDDTVTDFARLSCSEYADVVELEPAFQRDIIWNLDDISMLVGSNMQIFGGGRFPVVSLRLRDSTKPISILTGLDYWLDNLMCNVPELVMCYHLEGIVQKYEVVRTEELPTLDGCKFSPMVVKGIAQDILSFLRSKCTKEGHTYWLFKGSKSDIVKLYDLTSISNENSMDNCLNPFTFPVASLLYRIANNMIVNGIRNKKDAVAACSLLQNCIMLLEKENRSELMLAANYLLAQLYMQDSFPDEDRDEATDPSYDESFDEKCMEEDSYKLTDIRMAMEQSSISLTRNRPTDPGKAWLDSTREEKCRATISFVIKALGICNEISSAMPKAKSISYEFEGSDDLKSAKDDDEAQKKQVAAVVVANDKQLAFENHFEKQYGMHFDSNLKTRLQSNAIAAYSSLGEISIGKKKYGRALKFLKIALLSLDQIPVRQRPVSLLCLHAKVEMMIGDICLILAHKRNLSHEDYSILNEEDTQFVSLCSSNIFETCTDKEASSTQNSIDEIFKLSAAEDLLIQAVSWYESSLNVSPEDDKDEENVQQVFAVTARLGNVRNELGVFYMNLATALVKTYGEPTHEEQDMWKKSYQYFEKGIEAFSVINDKQNMALLYSNKARLMRLCSQAYGNSTRPTEEVNRGEFTQQERLYFNKAYEFYQKALSSLGSRASSPEVWDQISYDLSGAYFAMASTVQDNAPLGSKSFEEVSKEVQNLMMKSLHYCQDEENQVKSRRYKDIRQRMGAIHHRIASLYQYSLRNKGLDDGTRKLKSLAELHYNKAYMYLNEDETILEYLSTLNEHVGLNTQIETRATSPYTSIKRLKTALTLLLKNNNVILLRMGAKILETNKGETRTEKCLQEKTENNIENEPRKQTDHIKSFDCSLEHVIQVLSVVKLMLSNVLKDLVMSFSKSPKIKVVDKIDLAESKRMYEIFLRRSAKKAKSGDKIQDAIDLFQILADVIENIRAESTLDDL